MPSLTSIAQTPKSERLVLKPSNYLSFQAIDLSLQIPKNRNQRSSFDAM
jgi:hypothetical protein